MITLAQAKKHCNAEEHDEDDTLISTLIKAAYRYAENKTGTCFEPKEITIVLDTLPHSAGKLELPHTPVREITGFSYVDQTGQTQELDPAELRLDTRPVMPTLAPKFGTQWPALIAEPESVSITLAAGYDETPEDVQIALLLLIGHWYANREGVVIGTITSTVPMGVDMLLMPYTFTRIG